MRAKSFIFSGGVDAFTYLLVFILSMLIPSIISWVLSQDLLLLLTMAINSIGLIREYLLLYQFKKVTRGFWVERLVGVSISFLLFAYSISAMMFVLQDINPPLFRYLNVVFSILFCFPGVISAMEGIIYITNDYKENVVDEKTIVVKSTAIDV